MAKMSVPILVDWESIKDHLAKSDIVEVIRCKECKHKHIKENVWTCPFGLPAGCDFYCGYGERKTDDA